MLIFVEKESKKLCFALDRSGGRFPDPFAGNKGISVCNESRSFRVKEDLIINPITKTLISCCSKSDTIRIPDEVENIGEYAFSENSNVRNIYAPYSLKHTK